MPFSREIISRYFHVPLHQAAKHLNVGLSDFKLQCRDVGILRWPYRKLLSLHRLINYFQVSNKSTLTVESEFYRTGNILSNIHGTSGVNIWKSKML